MRPLTLLTLLAACAHPPATPTPVASSGEAAAAAEVAPAATASEDALAPRPYTADQIRGAMPKGTEIDMRIAASGQPTLTQRMVVTASDATGCTLATTVLDHQTGKLVEDKGSATHTWTELVGHASFPAKDTTITKGEVEVPAGHFQTTVYTVLVLGEDGSRSIETYTFADTLPGPPVLFTINVGSQEVYRMTQIGRGPAG